MCALFILYFLCLFFPKHDYPKHDPSVLNDLHIASENVALPFDISSGESFKHNVCSMSDYQLDRGGIYAEPRARISAVSVGALRLRRLHPFVCEVEGSRIAVSHITCLRVVFRVCVVVVSVPDCTQSLR